jgi:hypothetical protein
MSIFILFAIVLFNGEPRATYLPFPSMQACETAKAQLIKDVIAGGITDGNFTCTEHKTSKLT